jgi:hypothetical protein
MHQLLNLIDLLDPPPILPLNKHLISNRNQLILQPPLPDKLALRGPILAFGRPPFSSHNGPNQLLGQRVHILICEADLTLSYLLI